MDDDDDVPGTHSDWLGHPYTRKVERSLAQQHGNLLIELMGACERTADPCVAAAHARYKLHAEHLGLFQPRKRAP